VDDDEWIVDDDEWLFDDHEWIVDDDERLVDDQRIVRRQLLGGELVVGRRGLHACAHRHHVRCLRQGELLRRLHRLYDRPELHLLDWLPGAAGRDDARVPYSLRHAERRGEAVRTVRGRRLPGRVHRIGEQLRGVFERERQRILEHQRELQRSFDGERRQCVSPCAGGYCVCHVRQDQLLQRNQRLCRRSQVRLLGSVREDEPEQPLRLRPARQLWCAGYDHERTEHVLQPELPGAVPLTVLAAAHGWNLAKQTS
jgi:hypothetical protein